jgi:hypothetical protein
MLEIKKMQDRFGSQSLRYMIDEYDRDFLKPPKDSIKRSPEPGDPQGQLPLKESSKKKNKKNR